ncbi:hypothetical protein L3556_10645 [Candidatus Synechococcus calcipolaris G9]|uniref:Uncharacterized protein n=1 Tax=Candidatus Synechococcus calcipolaris G9 TaxID=1497997 RepID=A0ABT6F0N7_9SYNE|nr:hypothetical protein [Candidatus Synechococcus calcipolaris]MDG2991385.1 hypothetical protein [Candidatus Synechococcus calcipolaris G9]
MSDRPSYREADTAGLQAFLRQHSGSPPPPHPDLEGRVMEAVAAHPHRRYRNPTTAVIVGFIGLAGMAGALSLGWFSPRDAQLAQEEMEQLEQFIVSNWDEMFQEPEFQGFLEETSLGYQDVGYYD